MNEWAATGLNPLRTPLCLLVSVSPCFLSEWFARFFTKGFSCLSRSRALISPVLLSVAESVAVTVALVSEPL